MPIHCPRCDSPLELSDESCPVCLHMRSRQEIDEGCAEQKHQQAHARRRALVAAGWFSALISAVWCVHAFKLPLADRRDVRVVASALGGWAGDLRGRTWRTIEREARVPAADIPQVGMPEWAASRPKPLDTDGNGASAPVLAALATGPAAPAPILEWEVRGKVYELLDLRPGARLQLVFKDRLGAKKIRATTDRQGAFLVSLPPVKDGGYDVTVLEKGRPRRFIEDNIQPSYRLHAAARRRSEARELSSGGDLVHVPIFLPTGESRLEYDVALLPES